MTNADTELDINPIAALPACTITEALEQPERSRYLNGMCFELADALQQRYGYRLGVVWRDEPDDLADEDENAIMSSIVHVFAIDDNGDALDICGQRTMIAFADDWLQQPSEYGVYRIEAPMAREHIAAEIGEPELVVDLGNLMPLVDATDLSPMR